MISISNPVPNCKAAVSLILDRGPLQDLWGLKFKLKKPKYMTIGDMSRDLELENCIGTISHVKEHYSELMINVGNREAEVNRINKGEQLYQN